MKILLTLISTIIIFILTCFGGGERGKLKLVNNTQTDFYYFATITSEKSPYSFHPDSITIPKLEKGKSVIIDYSKKFQKGMTLTMRFYKIDSTNHPIRLRQARLEKCIYNFLEESNWAPWVIDKL